MGHRIASMPSLPWHQDSAERPLEVRHLLCYSRVEMVSYRSDQTYRAATSHGSHRQGSPRRPYSPVLTNTQGTKGRASFFQYTQPDYYGPQVALVQPTTWAGNLRGTPEAKMLPAERACPQLNTALPGHMPSVVGRKKNVCLHNLVETLWRYVIWL